MLSLQVSGVIPPGYVMTQFLVLLLKQISAFFFKRVKWCLNIFQFSDAQNVVEESMGFGIRRPGFTVFAVLPTVICTLMQVT